ncbi:MAG TPA: hypothetical protein VK631_29055 [Solirubrobacteraceae bacterium]|nr:hypothetical protein [Solirubrobacteraceae bacterium]
MIRPAVAAAVLVGLAGCGGASPDRRSAPAPPDRHAVLGELRSPDARSPFVMAGGGAWHCATAGRLRLAISAEGAATLSIAGMVLASVAPTRAVVNRACERGSGGGAMTTSGARGGGLGATVVRCRAPEVVIVDFRRGDLTVRAAGGGRFLAGAAVRPDRIAVAGYWGEGCAPA